MKFIADFHVHSRFARATSREITIESLAKWAEIKGIKVLGTGDFTHPGWLKEIRQYLEPAEPGLFKLKTKSVKRKANGNGFLNTGENTRFILTTEISCIYTKNDKVRKVHLMIFAPDLATVEKINARLEWIGNLKADGRPILGLDSIELLKIALQASPECLLIPCHIWTPWFAIFGSKSGFDSVPECFGDYSRYIYALETGMSADPKMCWRLSCLDNYTLISNSDAHSAPKIGREANVFEGDNLSYHSISGAIRKKSQNLKLIYTIEFFPEEGRYHFDGHRLCNIRFSPKESKENNNLCPVCHKPLTIGVLNRVEELADRPEGIAPEGAIPYKSLVPLSEIIADALGVLPGAKKVDQEYLNLIKKFGDEMNILIDAKEEDLKQATLPEVSQGIIKVRQGKVILEPGYDGVYGKVKVFGDGEQKQLNRQKALF